MEKFSRWNDRRTGINPFVPAKDNSSKVFRYTIGALLALIRIVCLAVFVLLLAVVSGIASVIPVPPVQRLLRVLLESTFAKMSLMMLGYYSIRPVRPKPMSLRVKPSTTLLVRGGQPASAKPNADLLASSVQYGDIIVSNWTSIVDVFYYTFAYSPVFVIPAVDGSMRICGPIGALIASLSPPTLTYSPKITPAEVLKATRGFMAPPVVVFAEACRSNNQAVMSFVPSLNDLATAIDAMPEAQRPAVHSMIIKRPECDCLTVGHWFAFLCRITSHMYNSMSVYSLPGGYTPQPSDKFEPNANDTDAPKDYAGHLRLCMLQSVVGIRGLASTAKDYVEFSTFYHNYGKPKQQ